MGGHRSRERVPVGHPATTLRSTASSSERALPATRCHQRLRRPLRLLPHAQSARATVRRRLRFEIPTGWSPSPLHSTSSPSQALAWPGAHHGHRVAAHAHGARPGDVRSQRPRLADSTRPLMASILSASGTGVLCCLPGESRAARWQVQTRHGPARPRWVAGSWALHRVLESGLQCCGTT